MSLELPSVRPRPISDTFKETGQNLRDSIPHIKIGKDINHHQDSGKGYPNIDSDFVNKIMRYLMIICMFGVIAYGVFRLITWLN